MIVFREILKIDNLSICFKARVIIILHNLSRWIVYRYVIARILSKGTILWI